MDSSNRLQHIINCLVEFRKLWLLSAILGLLAATAYAFFLQGEMWTSRQTMIIRDDLLGEHFKPGSFVSEEAMKSAQETVLETARRPEVIRSTLEQLGPDRKSLMGLVSISSSWPSEQTVQDFRGAVSFEGANGGEIGKSEVIVLAAKASNPERSIEFLTLLLTEVDKKLSEVRADRFESMESELRATCESTLRSRQSLEKNIMDMEAGFGTDISLVRSMNERGGGGSPSAFDNKLNEINARRRAVVALRDETQLMQRSLKKASQSSIDELPTSAELLANQPALNALVTSLATAKQTLAQQEGRFTARHTSVRSSRETVDSLKRQIKQAIPSAIRGLDEKINSLKNELALIDQMLQKNADKLQRVSRHRVPYATLTMELEKQTEDYSEASARLARMQSRRLASGSIKLLTPIGEPWIGTRADGLGKRALALAGGIAGLMIGLGMVMIVAPPYREPEVDAALQAQNFADDEDTVSEQRLADQLAGVLPTRQEAVAQNQPVREVVETTVERAVEKTVPVPIPPVSQPPVPQQAYVPPTPEPAQTESLGLYDEVSSTLSQDTPLEPLAYETNPAGFGEVAPVALEPVVSAPPVRVEEPRMAAAPTAEQAYLTPTPRTQVEPQQPQAEPVQYPVSPQPAPQPQQVETDKIVRSSPQTLASIFANMPQPKTDLGYDGDSETASESDSSEQIADRILDVTNQQMSETPVPAPQDSNQRESVDTIQLGGGILPQSEALPLQRRATYRPVDLARVEDPQQSGSDDQAGLTEESIDSVFSQLQQPSSRSVEPTRTYDDES